jgi:hypothetical protein
MDPDRAETLGSYAVFLEETVKVYVRVCVRACVRVRACVLVRACVRARACARQGRQLRRLPRGDRQCVRACACVRMRARARACHQRNQPSLLHPETA